MLRLAVPLDGSPNGCMLFLIRLARRGARVFAENGLELLDLTLLHLANGIAHDFVFVLIPARAHLRFEVTPEFGGEVHI